MYIEQKKFVIYHKVGKIMFGHEGTRYAKIPIGWRRSSLTYLLATIVYK